MKQRRSLRMECLDERLYMTGNDAIACDHALEPVPVLTGATRAGIVASVAPSSDAPSPAAAAVDAVLEQWYPSNTCSHPSGAAIARFDVNRDGLITPGDPLGIIQELNERTPFTPESDVNGDGRTTPLDALQVINFLNHTGSVPAAASICTWTEAPPEVETEQPDTWLGTFDYAAPAWNVPVTFQLLPTWHLPDGSRYSGNAIFEELYVVNNETGDIYRHPTEKSGSPQLITIQEFGMDLHGKGTLSVRGTLKQWNGNTRGTLSLGLMRLQLNPESIFANGIDPKQPLYRSDNVVGPKMRIVGSANS